MSSPTSTPVGATGIESDIEKHGDQRSKPLAAQSDEARALDGKELAFVVVGLLLSVLMFALDETILATAIPVILSHFNALGDVTWVISAYLLTQVSFVLTFGQALEIFPAKWVFLFSMALFELGSLLCAVAPSVGFLIFGRAVAGVGAGGMYVASYHIINETARLERRPLLVSASSLVFAFSSIVGPFIGGAFSQRVSWRWCFYINLPIGAIALAVVFFALPVRRPPGAAAHKSSYLKLKDIMKMDWIGCLLCLAMVVCFILPLQWGGTTRPWSDPTVIALLCLSGILSSVFIGWELYVDKGIVPLRVLAQRSVVGSCLVAFFGLFGYMIFIYYLPLRYQAVQGHGAIRSGLDILPFLLSTMISSTACGALTSAYGRYWPFQVIAPCLCAIGAGLLYSTDESTSLGKLVGYQILFGTGTGAILENTIIATEATVEGADQVPQGTSLFTFSQLMGGVIGITLAGTVFNNELASGLAQYAPQVPPGPVRDSVSAIYSSVSADLRPGVIRAYVRALQRTYLIGVPAGIIAFLGALMIK
ncbi:hypothetical protein BOTBODRAFT_105781 [Botryobasidium botryosum FD-172 SS1]|uniref:Major facilitator superfamily (MFS) profile domain-containing protein n=1 Tax=Botryobasidium botryosum (strain FD-172 SS1) TaxID=930990 RepID=A0A067MNV8_BOTB1|nr:hypothetical protein BOTBODRAFT_105781 [Botryobasidium botryosum FD-172 SS1]